MLPFLLGRPFLLKSSPPSHLLPLSHWTGTSGIIASVILTWQASRSCFLATWSRVSSLIHKLSLIQYVKPVKLARCMQIPSPFHPLELQKPLQLVHNDVHGPVKVPTHQGYRYWVSFIDDYSRFKAVYLLKRKSETFAAFKQFKAWAENVTGAKLGTLRDDKGGEYISGEFEAFCIGHGIQRQHTVRNRPQQNGIAERSNRTIEEGVVSMLYESGMPTAFWGEALAAFIHTSNRSFTSALPDMTPHEAFLGSKPDLSMLRVWGCTAYVLIQRDKRPLGSLGTHMEKCVFIGYPSGYKGWKFYSPGSKKVVISERADFDERYV